MILNPYKKIKELEAKVNNLRAQLFNDKPVAGLEARGYLEHILNRKVEWYDYTKLDHQLWVNYYNDAQQIVNGELFNNELNKYIADLIKFNAVEAHNWEQIMNVRTGIITLQSFKDRLNSITDPRKLESKEDIFASI